MGWTHIFGEIGKVALKGAGIAGQTMGGPLGTLVQIGAGIGEAELSHPPQSGAVKSQEVSGAALASPAVQGSPVAPQTKIELVQNIINSIVAILKALGELFPPPQVPQAPSVVASVEPKPV